MQYPPHCFFKIVVVWVFVYVSRSSSLATISATSSSNKPCFIVCDPLDEHGNTAGMISEITKLGLRAVPMWSRATANYLSSLQCSHENYEEDDDVTRGCNVHSFCQSQIAPQELMDEKGSQQLCQNGHTYIHTYIYNCLKSPSY